MIYKYIAHHVLPDGLAASFGGIERHEQVGKHAGWYTGAAIGHSDITSWGGCNVVTIVMAPSKENVLIKLLYKEGYVYFVKSKLSTGQRQWY